MNKDPSRQHQLRFLAARSIIFALIAAPFLFSPGSAVGQDMGDLLDGLNDAEAVKEFAEDPGKYVKDKLKGAAKDRLREAAFGQQMTAEMAKVFERVKNRLQNERVAGGACPRAAHNNAGSVCFDFYTAGRTNWLFHTLADAVETVLGGGLLKGELKDWAVGKTKDAIEVYLRDKFAEDPPESYESSGSKGPCTYGLAATIDYSKGIYEVIIAADCKCQPVRIFLGGYGVVAGWRLSASGTATATYESEFVKGTIGAVRTFQFRPNCNCTGDTPGLSADGGAGVHVPEGAAAEVEADCDAIVRGIAETEKTLDDIRKALNKARETLAADDELVRELEADRDRLRDEQESRLREYKARNCGSSDTDPSTGLPAALRIYFRSALGRFHGPTERYSHPTPEKQQQLDEDLKKAREKERQKAREGEEVGSIWTPPTGTTRIAVVGTVREEEVMITSRGTIGGTVTLETQDGEELAAAAPDEDGHFTIDFGVIASTLPKLSGSSKDAAFMIIRRDAEDNVVARTTVKYLPGTPPPVMGPPAPTPPKILYLENHQIYELAGQNFGAGAEVVVSDDQGKATLQETLSSSTNRIKYFLDGTVGPAQVRVWNEFGASKPFEVGIYNFGVTAGKTNLNRRERTNVNAFYEGLPAGTRIIFTNTSRNVTVKPNGRAKVSGNDITFTVRKSAGEVSMKVKARQAGDWGLDYRLEFPVSR